VEITLRGAHIKDSPFVVEITKNPETFDPSKSRAHGPGLEDGNTTIGPSVFYVETLNGKGEPVQVESPERLLVEIFYPFEDKEKKLPAVEIKELDCKFEVTYQPLEAGQHRVEVKWNPHKDLDIKMEPQHIENSPILVEILPGTDQNKSIVFGPLLEDTVYDTIPMDFHIQAKDKFGNNIPIGGDPFESWVEDENGKIEKLELKDNGDGTYDSTYAPVDHGRKKLNVTLRGKPVGGAPFTINVQQGATEASIVEKFTFQIRTKTKEGTFKTVGGDKFDVNVIDPNGLSIDGLKIEDRNDVTYLVSYDVDTSGEYLIRVRINGRNISGSPWRQLHFVEEQ